MAAVRIEQLGGFAGFGGAHLKSWGTVDLSQLSEVDRDAVESLFRSKGGAATALHPDQMRYRLTRQTDHGADSIEALEHEVPTALRNSVVAHLE